MTKRVFILEPTALDVKTAEQFGDIVYVYPPGARRPGIWTESFALDVIAQLEKHEYNPREDYFAVVGHLVQMALTIAALSARWSVFQVLLYNSSARAYTTRTLPGDPQDAQVSNRAS